MLDQLNALVDTIPKDQLSPLLDESFKAFNGAGYDFGSLLDSSSTADRATSTASPTRPARSSMTAVPLLDSQAQTTDATPNLGTQPGRHHRPGRYSTTPRCGPCCRPAPASPTRSRDCSTRSSRRCRSCWPISPRRPGLRDLQQVARTVAGAAAAVSRGAPIGYAGQQPDRAGPGRLRRLDRRPAGLHGRLPAAVAVALTRGHSPRSTPPMGCTASCRRIRRSPCAAPATTRASNTRASAPPPSRTATATSRSSHWPRASTCSGRPRSTRI